MIREQSINKSYCDVNRTIGLCGCQIQVFYSLRVLCQVCCDYNYRPVAYIILGEFYYDYRPIAYWQHTTLSAMTETVIVIVVLWLVLVID